MVDIQLIWDLHKSEVFKVGAVLGVPRSILVAPPSADLWDGQVCCRQSCRTIGE
jgi:NH3-dependent NAD+ synthetase